MHQYKIQYQKFQNVMVLAEVLVHDDRAKNEFVASVAKSGYWADDKTWIAPGCIQYVLVVA